MILCSVAAVYHESSSPSQACTPLGTHCSLKLLVESKGEAEAGCAARAHMTQVSSALTEKGERHRRGGTISPQPSGLSGGQRAACPVSLSEACCCTNVLHQDRPLRVGSDRSVGLICHLTEFYDAR